ncbi:unnamed protein product [Closterium sp. NIES-53]
MAPGQQASAVDMAVEGAEDEEEEGLEAATITEAAGVADTAMTTRTTDAVADNSTASQEGRGAGGGRGRGRGGRGGRGGGAASVKSAGNESESRDDRFPGQFFFVSTQASAGPENDEGFEEPAAVGKVTLHSLDYWVIDSGATYSMTPRADLLTELEPSPVKHVTSALGQQAEVKGMGKAMFKGADGKMVGLKNFTRFPFSSSEATAKAPLDEVVMDVVGPLKLGAAGAEYFLTIVDVYTRMTWVYVLSKKSDVAETVKTDWLPMVERQQNWLVKAIRTDRGGEFLSKEFGLWLKKNGIRHSLTMPYSPAMNGIGERANRTITETARGLLIEAGLPDYFWPDAVRSACVAKNRALTHAGADKWVPYVEWIGKKPQVDMLRVSGYMCMALVPKHLRHNKLGAKAIWAVHLGMAQNSKGWLLWDPFTKKFLVSRVCKFMENLMYKDWKAENEAKIGMRFGEVKSFGFEHVELPLELSSGSTTTRQSSLVNGGEEAKDVEEEEEEVQQVSERAPTLPSRTTSAPRIRVTPQQRQGLHVPATEAEGRGKRRIQAPNRLTYDALGKPAKSALAGAALMPTTLRTLLAGAVIKGWVVKQMDVTTAFLNGVLEEEIFMAQPEGFDDGSGRVLRLKKALYGLKHAPRQWYLKLRGVLEEIGFTPSTADHSLFMLGEGEQRSFMVVYVDDILIFSPSSDLVKEVMLKLQDKFKCKALGDVSFYLGLHIEPDVEKRCMQVHQRKYLEALAANFGLSEGHVATPFPSGFKCVKGPEEESIGEEEMRRFHSLVGSLMYAAVNTRPDIAFASGQLARVVQCPNEEQVAAGMRVAKYLGQTPTVGLQYSAAAQSRQKGADEDMTSVGGFICCVGGGPTAWESKNQMDQALSSVESEYMALFRAVREIVWQRRLLVELGEEQQGPTPLYCDSQGVIALAKNPVLHGLTKHMRVKWHWTRSMVAAGEGLNERREPESRPASPVRAARTSRRVPRPRPPAVPGTHQMALRPSTAPQRVPLPSPPASSLPALADPTSDSLRAASPTVARLLSSVVTDPSFESTIASALVTELVDFAAHCRLNFATSLVAESASVCPPSVEGECALSTDVLEDRQEEFQCFAVSLPHLVSTLLAPEGDPDAPDIPTPRSYAEAIEGPLSVGVDYFQTFSPTPKMTTLQVLLHVAAQRDYELHSLVFSTAFLQGSLHEEIWPRRPPGFTGLFLPGTQWRIRRPVYGLRQAPREWHDTLRTTLAALGFAPSTADPSLFLLTDTSLPPFYIVVYVDDLVFATADTAGLAHVKSELQKRHTCTDLGELRSNLGLHITQDRARRTITLTQSHMVQQVLQRFDFTYSSPQATPLSTRHSLSALPSDESVELSGPYPELVGYLMYLRTCTRPDLAYPLSILARYVAPGRHRPEHMAAAKRVLCYLCRTSGLGLVLGGRSPVVLTGHADASWVDDLATQRSSQGYTFSLEPPSSPPVLYVDHKAMLALCWEHRLEHITKHIALRYFLAHELQQRDQLRLAYVASQANTADISTKALQPSCFALLCLTGLVTPSSPPLCLWGCVRSFSASASTSPHQPTPLSTRHSLSAPPSDESVEPSGPYPELVGCFITSGMGLVLGGLGPVVLTGHADASWVDDSAMMRSSQGYTFSHSSGYVS